MSKSTFLTVISRVIILSSAWINWICTLMRCSLTWCWSRIVTMKRLLCRIIILFLVWIWSSSASCQWNIEWLKAWVFLLLPLTDYSSYFIIFGLFKLFYNHLKFGLLNQNCKLIKTLCTTFNLFNCIWNM